jgi:hypothetical protein
MAPTVRLKLQFEKKPSQSVFAHLKSGDNLQNLTTCRDESYVSTQKALLLSLLYYCLCVVVTPGIMIIKGGDLIRRRDLSLLE